MGSDANAGSHQATPWLGGRDLISNHVEVLSEPCGLDLVVWSKSSKARSSDYHHVRHLFQDGIDQRYIIALEYDAATENPQYFGRDKVKKYCQAFDNSHPIISHNNFQVITFADTRKRIVQLIRHSVKFINERMKFLFASIEDLKEYGDFLADIYIDPQRCNLNDEKIMCSIIY